MSIAVDAGKCAWTANAFCGIGGVEYTEALPLCFGCLAMRIAKRMNDRRVDYGCVGHLAARNASILVDNERVMSRFDPLKVGVMPASRTDEVIAELDGVFPGIEPVESVVACGLSSLNPIIHVPGCILNAGRIEYAESDCWEGGRSMAELGIDGMDLETLRSYLIEG